MNLSSEQVIKRQINRYHPNVNELYFELNINVSKKLDLLREKFENILNLDIGAGEIPFQNFYSGLNVVTCDIIQNSKGTIDHVIDSSGKLPFNSMEYGAIFLFDVLEHIKK